MASAASVVGRSSTFSGKINARISSQSHPRRVRVGHPPASGRDVSLRQPEHAAVAHASAKGHWALGTHTDAGFARQRPEPNWQSTRESHIPERISWGHSRTTYSRRDKIAHTHNPLGGLQRARAVDTTPLCAIFCASRFHAIISYDFI